MVRYKIMKVFTCKVVSIIIWLILGHYLSKGYTQILHLKNVGS